MEHRIKKLEATQDQQLEREVATLQLQTSLDASMKSIASALQKNNEFQLKTTLYREADVKARQILEVKIDSLMDKRDTDLSSIHNLIRKNEGVLNDAHMEVELLKFHNKSLDTVIKHALKEAKNAKNAVDNIVVERDKRWKNIINTSFAGVVVAAFVGIINFMSNK